VKDTQQIIYNLIKSEIQQQSRADKEEEIEIVKVIKKEIEVNREVILKENEETKAILMVGREEKNMRYKDLHEGLKTILRNSNRENPQLKELQENHRLNLQMNTEMQIPIERNNETAQRLEENIERVKELFEVRIQEVQGNINDARSQRSDERVVEILGNGQERICKEILDNNYELRMMQERILTNMKIFNESSTQEIKKMTM
jgi:hypothetical protein